MVVVVVGVPKQRAFVPRGKISEGQLATCSCILYSVREVEWSGMEWNGMGWDEMEWGARQRGVDAPGFDGSRVLQAGVPWVWNSKSDAWIS